MLGIRAAQREALPVRSEYFSTLLARQNRHSGIFPTFRAKLAAVLLGELDRSELAEIGQGRIDLLGVPVPPGDLLQPF